MVCVYELSWGRGPINFEPQEESLAMEVYRTWAKMFELQKYYSWIVDRFHISTIAHQKQAHNKDYDFKWLEEKLLPLNFHIVFCTRSPESFKAAREERLKVSGNPSQYDDLNPFIHEQELMRELIAKSMLPSLTLDVSNNDIGTALALRLNKSRTGLNRPVGSICRIRRVNERSSQ